MPSPRRRIGLLGGSFNPPHAGHVHLSRVARRMLKLDAVWWLVSPGNPLKPNPPPPMIDRLIQCAEITRDTPFIIPTDLEAILGTQYTVDTVRALKRSYPMVDFVWICGSDIAQQFHHWKDWQILRTLIPFICLARTDAVRGNHIRMGRARDQRVLNIPEMVDLRKPVWYWVMTGPRHGASSTILRKYLK